MYNGVYTIEQYAYVYDTLIKWLTDKVSGESLGDKLVEKGINSVAIYGVNGLGELAAEDIREKAEVVCFIDRNPSLIGTKRNGISVLGLDDLAKVPEKTHILIAPEFYFREIMDTLYEKGIDESRIISLSMLV
ncbi:MAG: hypothetical protein MJ113_01235 [Lachnospiraceae bacterium]|nr:hypothetical protein [Lachnospiraceae bacterium]